MPKRFQDGGGCGYGLFDFDAASAGFKPNGTGAKCRVACHTIVKSKDYVFNAVREELGIANNGAASSKGAAATLRLVMGCLTDFKRFRKSPRAL